VQAEVWKPKCLVRLDNKESLGYLLTGLYALRIPRKYFMEVFDFLTISATIDNKLFAVHGGTRFLGSGPSSSNTRRVSLL